MHSIWAVARNTLSQALRMKIAVVIILLMLVLLPIMGRIMVGDGTLLGKLQTFTSYSLGLISFLLCVLTIAIAAFTLSNDLKRKHIYLVLTKPIRRAELLAGKLLGIVLLDAMLLAVFGVAVFVLILLIWRYADVPAEQRLKTQAEFFTSRVAIKTELDKAQLTRRAQERYDKLKEQDQLPEGMSFASILGELYGQESMKEQKVDPGQVKEWSFENVRIKNPQDPNAVIFVRYKLQAVSEPPDQKIFSRWRVGDLRQFEVGAQIKTPVPPVDRTDTVRAAQEFAISASVIAPDGHLGLAFYNDPTLNQTTVIPQDVEVLYKTGGFAGNYLRAILLIFVRLIFLAVVGVSLSTWLSFPVTILICLVVFFAGLTNGFIVDAIGSLQTAVGIIYSFTVKPLLWLLPQFDGVYNPGSYIVEGRTLGWTFLAAAASLTLAIKAMLMLLLGIVIFNRREVAKAVV
ncbi:MAG: hypothetical protein LLF76_08635 [Planctomycetaceae bacterium]|nr:hypothetical protein [Planctomycetaceae bacterium]